MLFLKLSKVDIVVGIAIAVSVAVIVNVVLICITGSLQ